MFKQKILRLIELGKELEGKAVGTQKNETLFCSEARSEKYVDPDPVYN
jgi:hypothetical protein